MLVNIAVVPLPLVVFNMGRATISITLLTNADVKVLVRPTQMIPD